MIGDFVADLEEFPVAEIEVALQIYRRDSKNKFFPTPGAVREIILTGRRERAALAKSSDRKKPMVESRPILWWTQPPYLWQPTWREADIPEADQLGFRRRLAAKRKAGAQGWGENDFFGLHRKHNKHRDAA